MAARERDFTFEDRGLDVVGPVLDTALRALLGLKERTSDPFRRLLGDQQFVETLRKDVGLVSGTYGIINEFRNSTIQWVDSLDPEAPSLPLLVAEREGPSRVSLIPLSRRKRVAAKIAEVEKKTQTHLTTAIRATQAFRQSKKYPLTLWERGNQVLLVDEGELMLMRLERRVRELKAKEITATDFRSYVSSDKFRAFVAESILHSRIGEADGDLLRWGARRVSVWLQSAEQGRSAEFAEWQDLPGYWYFNSELAPLYSTHSWQTVANLVYQQTDDNMTLLDWLRTRRVHLDLADCRRSACILAFAFGPLMDEQEGKTPTTRLRGFFLGSFCSSRILRADVQKIRAMFSLLGQHYLMSQVLEIARTSEHEQYLGITRSVLAHKFKEPIVLAKAYSSRIRGIANGTSKLLTRLKNREEANRALLEYCEKLTLKLDALLDFVEKFLRYVRAGLRESRILHLRRVVERAVEESGGVLERAEVSLRVNIPKDLRCIGDEIALVEVVAGLIENACQVMQGLETRELAVDAEPGERYLTIQVADTGPGIPAQHLGRIFEPGVHFRKKTDTTSKPSGMGLSLSRKLVEAHGGALSAENREGRKGARFRIRLPVASAMREVADD